MRDYRDYNDLQNACQQLSFAAAFHNIGRLDAFLNATGDTLWGSEEFFCWHYYEILYAIADFTDIRNSEEGCVSRYYFSADCIRTYFDFVQAHAAQLGVPLKADPYYRNALDYFCNTMLSACPYCCWFRLVTQTHHKYGYGLSVWCDNEQFYDSEQLVFGLLDVIGYFKSNVMLLRAEGKIPENGTVLPFERRKEAA